MRIRKDTITAGFTIALAAAVFAASFGVKDFAATGVGAGFLPRIVAILLAGLGVILLLESTRRGRGGRADVEKDTGRAIHDTGTAPWNVGGPFAVLLSAALMIVYVGLLDRLGFMLTTAVYVFVQILVLSKGVKPNYLVFGVVALLTSIAAFYLFVRVFNVMLPAGILG